MAGERRKKTGLGSKVLLLAGVIVFLLACLYRFGVLGEGKVKVLTSSALTDAIDIAELSTAEFRYRGIADVYTDEDQSKEKCHICYSAVVKAGIDMEDVSFEVDNAAKTVTADLPEVRINSSIVNDGSLSIIPSNADVELAAMLQYCEEDAQREALASDELMETAAENLRSTIEGLLYPVLHKENYELVWRNASA